jgi:UDP-N-acetylmuramyl pentapeptide synthase
LADADLDGICDACECAGCQDETACNYDATATDPGECFYADPGFNCDGTSLCTEDLNGNGAVEVGDVLLVLAEFGCESGCTTDLTGDGFVAVDDILILLSAFGVSCQ